MPDKRISELPIVASVNGDDVSVLVRNGTDQQFSFSQLRSFIADQISTGARITFVTDKPQDLIGKDLDVAINSTNGKLYQKRSGTWTEAYTPATSTSGSDIIYGVGIPAASSGILNASYVDTANGNFYQKGPLGWRLVFSMLNGPAGSPGPKGDTGAPGINGRTILSGPLNPSNQTDGSNGDHYINTSTHKLFGPKTNGDWGTGVDMVPGEEIIGSLADLPTTDKTNIVAAIKELADNGIDAGDIDETLKIGPDGKLGVNPDAIKTVVPAWTVFGGVPFGKYANKMVVPAAESAFAQYKEAFQNVNPPTYNKPTISTFSVRAKLAGTSIDQNTGTIEVGQILDFTIDPAIILNDSPDLVDGPNPKPLSITKNSVEIGTTDPTADNGVVTSAAPIVYGVVYNYKGALIKNNDAGDPDPRTQFGAGALPTSSTITPRYRIFYGSIPSGVAITSDLVRGVSGGGSIASAFEGAGNPLSLSTGTTYRRFFVAVRSGSGKTLTVAKDVQTNGDVRSIYLAGKVTMNIKNGGTGDVSYDIYIYEQSVAYGDNHTHELTIA